MECSKRPEGRPCPKLFSLVPGSGQLIFSSSLPLPIPSAPLLLLPPPPSFSFYQSRALFVPGKHSTSELNLSVGFFKNRFPQEPEEGIGFPPTHPQSFSYRQL